MKIEYQSRIFIFLILYICLSLNVFGQDCNPHCYRPSGATWSTYATEYRINTNMGIGSTTHSDWVYAIEDAFSTWNNDYGGDFYYYRVTPDLSLGYVEDGESVVSYYFNTGGAPATTAIYISNGEDITECDTKFNQSDTYTWSTNPGLYELDIETVALHEFGHWSYLLDEHESQCSNNVMYFEISLGEINRLLTQDDKYGHQYNYPKPLFSPTLTTNRDKFEVWSGTINVDRVHILPGITVTIKEYATDLTPI